MSDCKTCWLWSRGKIGKSTYSVNLLILFPKDVQLLNDFPLQTISLSSKIPLILNENVFSERRLKYLILQSCQPSGTTGVQPLAKNAKSRVSIETLPGGARHRRSCFLTVLGLFSDALTAFLMTRPQTKKIRTVFGVEFAKFRVILVPNPFMFC